MGFTKLFKCRDTVPDDLLHLGHLFQHILCQGNLAAGTDQIVAGILGVEIQVAVQYILYDY